MNSHNLLPRSVARASLYENASQILSMNSGPHSTLNLDDGFAGCLDIDVLWNYIPGPSGLGIRSVYSSSIVKTSTVARGCRFIACLGGSCVVGVNM